MGMQSLELVEVAILFVIVLLLLAPWIVELRRRRPRLFLLASVGLAGLALAALALVLVDDVFPDRLEPIGRTALVVGIVGGGLLLSFRDAT